MDILNPFDILQLFLLCAFGYGFYKVAELEESTPWMWAGASAIVYCYMWLYLRDGMFTNMLGQLAVAIVIAIVRAIAWARKEDD